MRETLFAWSCDKTSDVRASRLTHAWERWCVTQRAGLCRVQNEEVNSFINAQDSHGNTALHMAGTAFPRLQSPFYSSPNLFFTSKPPFPHRQTPFLTPKPRSLTCNPLSVWHVT